MWSTPPSQCAPCQEPVLSAPSGFHTPPQVSGEAWSPLLCRRCHSCPKRDEVWKLLLFCKGSLKEKKKHNLTVSQGLVPISALTGASRFSDSHWVSPNLSAKQELPNITLKEQYVIIMKNNQIYEKNLPLETLYLTFYVWFWLCSRQQRSLQWQKSSLQWTAQQSGGVQNSRTLWKRDSDKSFTNRLPTERANERASNEWRPDVAEILWNYNSREVWDSCGASGSFDRWCLSLAVSWNFCTQDQTSEFLPTIQVINKT